MGLKRHALSLVFVVFPLGGPWAQQRTRQDPSLGGARGLVKQFRVMVKHRTCYLMDLSLTSGSIALKLCDPGQVT